MPRRPDHPRQPARRTPSADSESARGARDDVDPAFDGFEGLESNFIYTPNQFLDLCIPLGSRGVVRLVGYVLRQTLGWLDHDGVPLHEQVVVSYQQIIRHAGVSRGAVRAALDDAERLGFLRCIRRGEPHRAGVPASTGLYEIRWDDTNHYAKELDSFAGFWAGDGRRTPIPNQFFDRVIPTEPLAVTKVVGTVLRHTVGFASRYGGRRRQTPLAYTTIQNHAHIGGRRHVSAALKQALAKRYIRRVTPGRFDPLAVHQEAAVYAVRWRGDAEDAIDAGDTTIQKGTQAHDPQRAPAQRPRTGTSPRSNKATSKRPKREPADGSGRELSRKQQRHFETQQQAAVVGLVEEGLDEKTALRLVEIAGEAEVGRQLSWIDARRPSRSRAGMLRRAIEERWPKPDGSADDAVTFARHFYAGLHRQAGAPVAQPTAEDVAVAASLLERLADTAGESAADLGRAFGQEVGQMARPPSTLAAASRSRVAAHFRRPSAPARPVVEREVPLPDPGMVEPDVLAKFEADRRRRRAELASDPAFDHPRLRSRRVKLLEQFDAEATRLRDLRTFLDTHEH
ncbi:MAG: hypothetical protein AAF743_13055 [Planctomycetota bacterium]